jgi:hypothetical protein
MKVYLDSERTPPKGWVHVKTPRETIDLLETGNVSVLSLDHDLGGDDTIGTGYDVLNWLKHKAVFGGLTPPVIHIHTANPAARKRMKRSVEWIQKSVRTQMRLRKDRI